MDADKPLSKTAAIELARSVTGSVLCRNSDYVFYAPHHLNNPHGPTTEYKDRTFSGARSRRANVLVNIALHAMGVRYVFSDPGWRGASVAELIDYAIEQHKQYGDTY